MRINGYYGTLEERVLRIVPGSVWLVRTTAKKFPADKLEVLQLHKLEDAPIPDWRVRFSYEGRKGMRPANCSVKSFLSQFRRLDEQPVSRTPEPRDDRRERESAALASLHLRVTKLTNIVKELCRQLGFQPREEDTL